MYEAIDFFTTAVCSQRIGIEEYEPNRGAYIKIFNSLKDDPI